MNDTRLCDCDKCGHSIELYGKTAITFSLNKDTKIDHTTEIFKCANCNHFIIPIGCINHIFGIHESINRESMICHMCGKNMLACKVSKITLHDLNITLLFDDLDGWKCPDCEKIAFPTFTIEKIQIL